MAFDKHIPTSKPFSHFRSNPKFTICQQVLWKHICKSRRPVVKYEKTRYFIISNRQGEEFLSGLLDAYAMMNERIANIMDGENA